MNNIDHLDFGPPIKLATKQQLAVELTDREDGLMTICAFQLPDGRWDAAIMVSAEFGNPPNAPKAFRWLADLFEGADYLPRPNCD